MFNPINFTVMVKPQAKPLPSFWTQWAKEEKKLNYLGTIQNNTSNKKLNIQIFNQNKNQH